MSYLKPFVSIGKFLRTANFPYRTVIPSRMASTNPNYFNAEEPYAEFKERFITAFERHDLDGWWLRHHLQNLHMEDIIPEPDIIRAIYRACRRLNDLALAIRYTESLRHKCDIKPDLFPWLMQEVAPTMKELGIPTLEELGYDQPELYTLDYDD